MPAVKRVMTQLLFYENLELPKSKISHLMAAGQYEKKKELKIETLSREGLQPSHIGSTHPLDLLFSNFFVPLGQKEKHRKIRNS